MAVFYIGSTMVANMAGNFPYEVVSSLPTASASTMGTIYVLIGTDSSTLYLTAETSGNYSWQQVGTLSASVEVITEEIELLGLEINKIKENIGFEPATVNLISGFTTKYLFPSGGKFTNDTTVRSIAGKIKPGTTYTIDHKTTGNRFICYFSEEEPANNIAYTSQTSFAGLTEGVVTAGANDNYLLIYIQSTNVDVDYSDYRIYEGTDYKENPTSDVDKIDEMSPTVEAVKAIIPGVGTVGLFNKEGYFNSSGTFVDTSNAKMTDYLPILDTDTTLVYNTQMGSGGAEVAFFNAEKQFITGIVGTSTMVEKTIDLTLPAYANAKYLVVSCYGTNYFDSAYTYCFNEKSILGLLLPLRA